MSSLSLSLVRSSFSKSRTTGYASIVSLAGLRMPANISCSRNVSREPRKYGLKTKIRWRKSIASDDDPGYFSWRLARGFGLNVSRYSSALSSVMKFESASVGVPIILKIRES